MRLISLYSSIALLLCASCQKVIHLDLNSAEKKYVIEGVVTNQTGTCQVLISQTKDFDDDNTFPGISGATVQITEVNGATTLLIETSAGVYEAPTLKGSSGKTYHLSVTIPPSTAGGQAEVFTATSTMPQPVNLDSLFFTTDGGRRNNTHELVNVQFKDPATPGNNYRFVQYVNGVKEKKIFIRNDDLNNGNTVTSTLRYPLDANKDNEIKTGDLVQVDMLCIDPAVYTYWYSLDRSATGDGNAATPANPVSNLAGDALGYFSAHTLQSKTIIAP